MQYQKSLHFMIFEPSITNYYFFLREKLKLDCKCVFYTELCNFLDLLKEHKSLILFFNNESIKTKIIIIFIFLIYFFLLIIFSHFITYFTYQIKSINTDKETKYFIEIFKNIAPIEKHYYCNFKTIKYICMK